MTGSLPQPARGGTGVGCPYPPPETNKSGVWARSILVCETSTGVRRGQHPPPHSTHAAPTPPSPRPHLSHAPAPPTPTPHPFPAPRAHTRPHLTHAPRPTHIPACPRPRPAHAPPSGLSCLRRPGPGWGQLPALESPCPLSPSRVGTDAAWCCGIRGHTGTPKGLVGMRTQGKAGVGPPRPGQPDTPEWGLLLGPPRRHTDPSPPAWPSPGGGQGTGCTAASGDICCPGAPVIAGVEKTRLQANPPRPKKYNNFLQNKTASRQSIPA